MHKSDGMAQMEIEIFNFKNDLCFMLIQKAFIHQSSFTLLNEYTYILARCICIYVRYTNAG